MCFSDDLEIEEYIDISELHVRAKHKRAERFYRQNKYYRGRVRRNIWYRRPGFSRWLKTNCNRYVRRRELEYFPHHKSNLHKKVTEYWWTMY